MVSGGQVPSPDADEQLRGLGIELPAAPTPFGAYVETVQSGDLLFLSGMVPVVDHQPRFIGRVGGELTVEDGCAAARTACLSALAATKLHLGSLNRVSRIVRLGVFIATEGDFRQHPKVADGASELLLAMFGADRLPARMVLGVASIPLGMPIELELTLEIDR
jgi:enamine deaminase RidA (YjgF/YER057c/UK114 family)